MKSFEVCNAKGKTLVVIQISRRGTITVLWVKSGDVMTFRGKASIIAGNMIIPVSANGVELPASLVKTSQPQISLHKLKTWVISSLVFNSVIEPARLKFVASCADRC